MKNGILLNNWWKKSIVPFPRPRNYIFPSHFINFLILFLFVGCACRFLYGADTKDEHKREIEKSLDAKTELKLEVIFYKKNGKRTKFSLIDRFIFFLNSYTKTHQFERMCNFSSFTSFIYKNVSYTKQLHACLLRHIFFSWKSIEKKREERVKYANQRLVYVCEWHKLKS